MSEIKHTPTPWKQEGRQIVAPLVRSFAVAQCISVYGAGVNWSAEISKEEANANAAFIVTAVNAYAKHRALIETLTAALKPIKDGYESSAWHFVAGEKMKRILIAESGMGRINSALAAAKELGQ